MAVMAPYPFGTTGARRAVRQQSPHRCLAPPPSRTVEPVGCSAANAPRSSCRSRVWMLRKKSAALGLSTLVRKPCAKPDRHRPQAGPSGGRAAASLSGPSAAVVPARRSRPVRRAARTARIPRRIR